MKMTSKSFLRAGSNFEFGKEIMIQKMIVQKEIFLSHEQKLKETFPNDSPEVTKSKAEGLIFREYTIGAIFDFLIPLFDYKIDPVELAHNIKSFKTNTGNLTPSKKDDEKITFYIDRLLKQQLVIEYFVEHVNKTLFPSKEDAIAMLDAYYKESNKSIRELKTEQGIIIIQDTICQERFSEWIKNQYKIKFDFQEKQKLIK